MNNRVIIVDDHPPIRMALRLLLSSEGYNVVAEVGDGAEIVALVETHEPSIVILDLGLPDRGGLSILEQLAALQFPVKIVVFTGQTSSEMTERCRQMGAHGFISKAASLMEVANALRTVRANDESFFCWSGVPAVDEMAPQSAQIARLSSREYNVMKHLLQGMKGKDIADYMGLDQRTISTYKRRMFTKLNVKGMPDLYGMAKRYGIF